MKRGIIVRTVINNFTFDGATADPVQKAIRDALISFMAATAQSQAEATKAAQRAGIAHAKEQDERAYLGRTMVCPVSLPASSSGPRVAGCLTSSARGTRSLSDGWIASAEIMMTCAIPCASSCGAASLCHVIIRARLK
jgi:hypothetical protein